MAGSTFPLVTVGLPVFNGEEHLHESLSSLCAQTWPNLEIVVSDNASTDRTLEICEEFAARDPRIKLLRSAVNRGAAWNHNEVLRHARGTYFKWFGADDVAAPRFVEACVTALERDPSAVLAYPLTEVIDDRGEILDRTETRLLLDDPDPGVRFGQVLSAMRNTQNPFYGVARTQVVRGARPLGAFLANDRCVVAQLSLVGRFVRVEEYLMRRRSSVQHDTRTRAGEQYIMSPATAHGFWTREWRMLWEHLRSALRAHVTTRTKLRLLRVLSGWAIGMRGELLAEVREIAAQPVRHVRHRRSHHKREEQDGARHLRPPLGRGSVDAGRS